MSYIVPGAPFLRNFQDSLACLGLPALPSFAHLCLSQIVTQDVYVTNPDVLAQSLQSSKATYQGLASICGYGAPLGARLGSFYFVVGTVNSVSVSILDAPTITNRDLAEFELKYNIQTSDGGSYICSLSYYNAVTQDTKYILSAPPKCGSKFSKAPSSAITPEASCFGALQFDVGNLAARYGATPDTMALYSLGTDKLVYHSIGLGETKGTFVLSDKDTIRGDVKYLKGTLENDCIASMTDDSSSGNFFFSGGDVSYCGGKSFTDRFLYLFRNTLFIAASYVDLDTVIVVINRSNIISSNVGAKILPVGGRRDGIVLDATDWMLVYKREIPSPAATSATSAVLSSTFTSSTILSSTVPSTSLDSSLATTWSTNIVLSSTASDSRSSVLSSTTFSATASSLFMSSTVASATVSPTTSATVTIVSSTFSSNSVSSTTVPVWFSSLSTNLQQTESSSIILLSATVPSPTTASGISILSTATFSANTGCKTNTPSQALTNIANGPIPASSSQNYSTDATDALATLIKQAPVVLAKTKTYQVDSTFLLTGPLAAGADVNLLGASFTGGINGVGVLISSVEYKV
ncbi:hypothetical protein HDU79_000747 [Rhizoclosmatium sp. JEL0117]|nr:hypothetical protein HDU79_000747 [Rhizoclosmatium sp. JEL0117]